MQNSHCLLGLVYNIVSIYCENSIVWSVWSLLLFKYFSISLLFLLSYFWFRFSLVNFLCHNLGLAYLQQNLKLILDKLSEIRLDKCCQKDQTLFAKYKKTWLRNLYGKVWILFAFQWRLLWWSGFQKQSCNLRPGKHFLYFVFSPQMFCLTIVRIAQF